MSTSRALALLALLAGCEGAIGSPSGSVGPTSSENPTVPDRLSCADRVHAARSAMRRLTVDEYRRAVANLFGGKVAASANFPVGTGYKTSRTGYSTEPDMNPVSE